MSWSDLCWLSLFSLFGSFLGLGVVVVMSLIIDRIYEGRERQAERKRWDVRNN